MKRILVVAVLALAALAGCSSSPSTSSSSSDVAVTFSGGLELQPDDYGRPVPLYASMLGVAPDVFRQAFSGVNPNPNHQPTPEEEEANKAALLAVLAPYGVTDQKMNEVADYYRFDSTKGETWQHRTPTAHAVVENGQVVRIDVDDPGVGYPYPPMVTVAGYPQVSATVTLAFTTSFDTNGHLASIQVA